MLVIPSIYKDTFEDYITLPAIKKFMSDNNIYYNSSAVRSEQFDCIVDFGNESESNKETVLAWIDNVVLEGIRDIHVRYFPLEQDTRALIENQDAAMSRFRTHINDDVTPHLCSNTYNEELTLVSVRWMGKGNERKIVFTYCKKLLTFETRSDIRTTKSIDYPIIAEYYIEGQWLLVIAKPRSSLYEYDPDFILDKPTTTEKQIREAFDKIEAILPKEGTGNSKTYEVELKNKLFHLIDKYTSTPAEIKSIMSSKAIQLDTIKNMLAEVCHVQGKCRPPSPADIQNDIGTIVEKYLSINWHDDKIFTQDRKAYPTKLNSTDDEETKVEQTAMLSQPLQKKSAFFDNKKTLYKSKSCNSVIFIWTRKNPWYLNDANFPVTISVKKNECVFKFTKYTRKEDIDDVIFSIIGANENTGKP